MGSLFDLEEKLSSALHVLVVQKHRDHAGVLLRQLYEAVDRFTIRAALDPSLFREAATLLDGIPGIVSPSREKSEAQNELLDALEVGRCYPLRLNLKKQRGKPLSIQSTPPNLWASRLLRYISEAIPRLEIWQGSGRPTWGDLALGLDRFSKTTCEEWFKVAWLVVLAATEGHPEREPVLYEIGKAGMNRKRSSFAKKDRPGTRAGFVRDTVSMKNEWKSILPPPFSFGGPWKGESLFNPSLNLVSKRVSAYIAHADAVEKRGNGKLGYY